MGATRVSSRRVGRRRVETEDRRGGETDRRAKRTSSVVDRAVGRGVGRAVVGDGDGGRREEKGARGDAEYIHICAGVVSNYDCESRLVGGGVWCGRMVVWCARLCVCVCVCTCRSPCSVRSGTWIIDELERSTRSKTRFSQQKGQPHPHAPGPARRRPQPSRILISLHVRRRLATVPTSVESVLRGPPP